MPRIVVYTTDWCGYCERAKVLLDRHGLEYDEVRLDDRPDFRRRLLELTGGRTVPQIVVDGERLGGYLELWKLARTGELDRLAA